MHTLFQRRRSNLNEKIISQIFGIADFQLYNRKDVFDIHQFWNEFMLIIIRWSLLQGATTLNIMSQYQRLLLLTHQSSKTTSIILIPNIF